MCWQHCLFVGQDISRPDAGLPEDVAIASLDVENQGADAVTGVVLVDNTDKQSAEHTSHYQTQGIQTYIIYACSVHIP